MGSNNTLPRHVGIIMDGNGRWANLRGKNRSYGHKKGSDNVEIIVRHAFNLGVESLTLYAFSTENWQRPKEEVDELMRLLSAYFKKFIKTIVKNKIRLQVVGDFTPLSEQLKEVILDAQERSKHFTEHTLNIAVNYGGRQEIIKAVNELIKEGKEITLDGISERLYTANCGEPDLIIRTGGELRLSNFMLYQGAYSELYFTDVLWPDFNEIEFDKAMKSFGERKRRFGKV